MTDLWNYLKTATKPIVLYGTGNGADKVYARLCADGVNVSGVFSSAGFKKGRTFYGHNVCEYAELEAEFGEMIILVCFGTERDDVIENIVALSKEQELYVPDVPVYGEDIFDIAFARENADKIRAVYGMLADEKSKKVFENTVYFKLTGKPEYLYEIETDAGEEDRLLCLGERERFLDLGAFTGDTVAEFVNSVNGYDGILAVEPDCRNYRKLCENVGGFDNLLAVNAAVGGAVGTIKMSKQHGRGIGGTERCVDVECTTIDTLAREFSPTYIKMDVEGNEMAAISGGKNTISTLLPKLKIACYHNSYDLFEIPLKIKEVAGAYNVYMRHRRALPAWDTAYIFKRRENR